MANFSLRQLGHTVRVVRGDLPLDPGLHTIVITGALLDLREVNALDAWVRSGRTLIWHGPDPVNWGHEYIALLGARPVDYRADRPATIELFGDRWTLDAYPHNMRAELIPDRATTLAADQDGLPTVLTHHVGLGKVVYALPVVESSIASVADDRDARSRWQRWYRGMLQS